MVGSKKRTIGFSKRFCPETCSEEMEIPISFKESVQLLPKEILLRNSFNQNWIIEIIEIEDTPYFQNGWPKFVKDNLLTNGDRLVFDYDGYGVFDFVIFDKFAREKVALDAISQVIRELRKDEPIVVVGDVNVAPKRSNVSKLRREVKARKRNNAGGSKKGDGASAGEGSSRNTKRVAYDHYGTHLFASGQIPKPENPYFVTRIGRTKRNALYIPVNVVKTHNLTLPSALMLRSPEGHECEAKVVTWNDKRTWVLGPGWQEFCQENFIEEGKQYICEFVHPGTKDMFLQIKFVQEQATQNNMEISNSV